MTTITIPIKEYKQSIQIQKSILSRLDLLQKVVFENSKDEINPSVIKHFEKISVDLDNNKGKKFNSISSFKNYLRKL
ncbi:MAG TPA: hypothetical protein VMR49_01240 [Candidatus Paceibacterota bacterium]|jgi:hypothetical protein|nr:hypothetical protein [Candidatus Paceibacterota bacterium]